MLEVTIPLRSNDEAVQVLGPYDRYAKMMRQALAVEITTRGGNIKLSGDDEPVGEARRRIEHVLGKLRKGRDLEPVEVEEILLGPAPGAESENGERAAGGFAVGGPSPLRRLPGHGRPPLIALRVRPVEGRTANQRAYLDAAERQSLTFGIGIAGTGKTFLAVWAAVKALRSGACRRLIITRPVVEAGERLGFLPGDVQAKLNPYMRPIYDALQEMLAFDDVHQLEEHGVVEIAPLAFMRGRTLSNSFVILDEAQNATAAQMRMFLTRLGEGSRMVVTGDPSQSDLEDPRKSGLVDAVRRLRGIHGVAVVEFDARDIVRHPLVEQIVRAYERPSRQGELGFDPPAPGSTPGSAPGVGSGPPSGA